MSEEYPGGYSREFLEALEGVAQRKILITQLINGPCLRDDGIRFRGIIRETTALLEAHLLDDEMIEEAANELALWLEQDPMLENEAHRVVRENLK